MNSLILVSCLLVSAVLAEPQKTAGLEVESKKSDKLQFSPADAQVYTASGALVPQRVAGVAGVATVVDQYTGIPTPVAYAPDQVIPGYYAPGAAVTGAYNPYTPYGVLPYSSVGRTTVTSTSQNGLPTGTVYEHTGTSHVGHLATAVHVKRPGQWYASPAVLQSPYYTSQYYAAGAVAPGAYGAIVPANLVPAHFYSQNWAQGQVQYINGQPAQYLNGNWYYVNAGAIPQYSSVYTNLKPGVVRAPGFVQPLANPLWNRPAVAALDNKWYTKTNTQQVVQQPFFSRPEYVAAAGTKTYAVPRPQAAEVEADKADW